MFGKFMAATLIAALVTLTGCNTMAGFGRDVEKTGDKIEKSAEKAKN